MLRALLVASRGDGLRYAALCGCILFLVMLSQRQTFGYFRDYAIIFEGAYRLSWGQVPYRDFGLPVGPVSFLLPSLFFKLWGPKWSSLLLCQLVISSLTLTAFNGLLMKLRVPPCASALSLIAFTSLYLQIHCHPWYNTTALLLVIITATLALGRGARWSVAAGIAAGLCILTKQDFGAVAVVMGAILIGLLALGSDGNRIVGPSEPESWPHRLREVSKQEAFFFASAASIVAALVCATDVNSFVYWFNYGQPPHHISGPPFRDKIEALAGSTGTLLLVFSLLRDNFRVLVAAMFFLAGSLTVMTSGANSTSFYAVAFVPVVLSEVLSDRHRYRHLLALAIATHLTFVCKDPAKTARGHLRVTLNHLAYWPAGEPPPKHFSPRLAAFSGPVVAPAETVIKLDRFVSELSSKTVTEGRRPRILNLSELTPLYAVFEQSPPTSMPLWFHSGVASFERDVQHLETIFADNDYDAVLLQGTHEGHSPNFQRLLRVLEHNPEYRKAMTIIKSPAGFHYRADIVIFIRR